MSIVNRIKGENALPSLLQTDNFVGWVYGIDYENAQIMTNDLWKARVQGVPHNSFLLAAAFDPEAFSDAKLAQQEVILLRVIGSTRLPMDDDLVRTKIEHFQERRNRLPSSDPLDDLTRNQLQFSGLQTRILGTFYSGSDGRLRLGSDLETYHSAVRLQVYKPRGDSLKKIVNYINPIREKNAREEAKRLGIAGSLPSFPIGRVRFTSANRLQAADTPVEFHIQSVDFLARRTAVFGMTRTGKSNMIKKLVSVVKRTADDTKISIGQIIYDLNGEYANANKQDDGAIADIYPEDTVRYRMLPAAGFNLIQNNFYVQIAEGFSLLRDLLSDPTPTSADLKAFINCSFDRPDDHNNRSAQNRYQVRCAIYHAILHKAGFAAPKGFRVKFQANKKVREIVDPEDNFKAQGAELNLSPDDAVLWFTKAQAENKPKSPLPSSTRGSKWLDEDSAVMLNLLAGLNSNGAYITGYKHLSPYKAFHSPDRTKDVGEEVYEHLLDGKIVILDLSVGDPKHRTRLSTAIARHVFNRSMRTFNEGNFPPNIVIYVEEAHNIIGKKDDLTATWPRIAKEGAKFRIATVYATQEVSSIHQNILANTENMFVSHLNNESEVKELAKFYDFKDFGVSLIRAQDVGFARVKTLSSPFVVPVQIHKFDPEEERKREKAP